MTRTDTVQNRWLAMFLIFMAESALMASADGTLPVMEQSISRMNITEGQNAIMPCMVNNLRREQGIRYKVSWVDPRKQIISYGSTIAINDRRFSIVKPSNTEWNLRIYRVRGKDAGLYRCQLNTDPVQEKSVFIYVQVPPSIVSSKDMVVAEGQDVNIYCNVSGKPTPSLRWYRNGQAIPEITSEVLTIQNISRKMAGSFLCFATNGINPNLTRSITVNVQFSPKVMLYSQRIGQYRYKEVILVCRVIANPLGKIMWYKEGKAIHQNWKYHLKAIKSVPESKAHLRLNIESLEKEDFGTYTCVAENNVGYDEASMQVYELTKPKVTTTHTPTRPSTMDLYSTTRHGMYGSGNRNDGESGHGETGGHAGKGSLVIETGKTSPPSSSARSSAIDTSLLILTTLVCVKL